ncbi:MAG: excinuclease ABC subunit UvrB [Eubacteriales bacterium]|nr:excinuclease ABC subunit UvrB [Eubacteriales bacterium]
MDCFHLETPYRPTGDQPQAIKRLSDGVQAGLGAQVLLGVTGSGKTFTMANIIANCNRPTLIIEPNKTLAAQVCSEMRRFFPKDAVEYFVSYYDYYQPEAYIPGKDLYIEKDALINEEIDKLRHSATSSLFEQRNTIIVASVSCIYSLGDPAEYQKLVLSVRPGMQMDRDAFLARLVAIGYERNDFSLARDKFRVRGDTVEIVPANSAEKALRVEFFADEIDRVCRIDVLTGQVLASLHYAAIYPATHYAVSDEKREAALHEIAQEMEERVEYFRQRGELLEAQRIEQRTRYDLEMLREVGSCAGVENYSRVLSGRAPGSTPYTLLDFFPRDYLLFIDESHVTVPQIRGMSGGDRARKENLVRYGFRLPSAFDNRPLFFHEFEEKCNQVIYVSATPGDYELEHAAQTAEQIIRPTGLLDPLVEVRPVQGQVDDLLGEIRLRTARSERVLVTTLTTKMAEDLTEYLETNGVRVRYIHHKVDTLERTALIRDLRCGVFDVLVGINLLREGLDLPEVSLVAVLDADKEGFLRSTRSLIQTIGRAARNENGTVLLYADTITASMEQAMRETKRRRSVQDAYNKEHGIQPRTVQKPVAEPIAIAVQDPLPKNKSKRTNTGSVASTAVRGIPPGQDPIAFLTEEMHKAAAALAFEQAAYYRDQIAILQNKRKKQ